MKKKFRAFIFIVMSFIAASCTKVGLFVLNSTSRMPKKFVKQKNIAFGSDDRLKLDVYYPKDLNQNSDLPVVIFFYGGSWQSGSKSSYAFLAKTLTSLNVIAVIPDYRLYPEVRFPTFVEDAALSVDWVQNNIQDYGGDSQQIYVMGHSAGAHIASLLAYDKTYVSDQKTIKGFIGLAGPYDFLPFTNKVFEKIFAPEEKFHLSQPINFVSSQSPATLLIHSSDDKTVGIHNSKNLAVKLKAHNVSVTTHYYSDLSHADTISKLSKLLLKKELVQNIEDFIFKQNKK